MTGQEYAPFEHAAAHRYAEAMVEGGYWPPSGSYERARDVHAKLLPQGEATPDHHLFVIESPAELMP